jgi:hypothetical protein
VAVFTKLSIRIVMVLPGWLLFYVVLFQAHFRFADGNHQDQIDDAQTKTDYSAKKENQVTTHLPVLLNCELEPLSRPQLILPL